MIDLETIDSGFDNLDFDVKFNNPRGLDREKLLKMIMENSILILKIPILKFNLRIPWAGSGEPFKFFIVPTDNLWMVRLLFLLENVPIRGTFE